MSDSSDQLAEFWEAVDSGTLSEDEIERDLNKMDQPESRRTAETGVDLLGLLGDMRPTAGVESGQTLPVVNPSLDAPLLREGVTIGRYELQEKLALPKNLWVTSVR